MSAVAEVPIIRSPDEAKNREEILQYIKYRYITVTRFLRNAGVSESKIPSMQFVFSRLFSENNPRQSCHPASNLYIARGILIQAGFAESAIALNVFKNMHRGTVRK